MAVAAGGLAAALVAYNYGRGRRDIEKLRDEKWEAQTGYTMRPPTNQQQQKPGVLVDSTGRIYDKTQPPRA